MRNMVLLVVFCFGVFSCKNKQNENNIVRVQTKNSINISNKNYNFIKQCSDFSDLFEQKKIIHLETNSESLIGKIEDLIYLPHEKK